MWCRYRRRTIERSFCILTKGIDLFWCIDIKGLIKLTQASYMKNLSSLILMASLLLACMTSTSTAQALKTEVVVNLGLEVHSNQFHEYFSGQVEDFVRENFEDYRSPSDFYIINPVEGRTFFALGRRCQIGVGLGYKIRFSSVDYRNQVWNLLLYNPPIQSSALSYHHLSIPVSARYVFYDRGSKGGGAFASLGFHSDFLFASTFSNRYKLGVSPVESVDEQMKAHFSAHRHNRLHNWRFGLGYEFAASSRLGASCTFFANRYIRGKSYEFSDPDLFSGGFAVRIGWRL